MLVKVVTRWSELARHTEEWWALMSRSSTDEPCLSPLWMDAWWRVFGKDGGRRLYVVLLYERGRLVGLAPLLSRPVWYRGAIPVRRVELLASGEPREDEICSEYLNVLVERGKEPEVARALVEVLMRGSLGLWDELVLDVMDGRSDMTERLMGELERGCGAVEVAPRRPCPYTRLPATWEEYLARLPSRHRYVVRRALRDLEAWAEGDVEVVRAGNQKELVRGQRILAELHGQRWQDAGHEGAFASGRFRAFHGMVMPWLLERGQLDLMWLCCKGEPIAAVYNIIWNRKVYFYQSGRRMDLPKKLRPGIAMHAHAIQRAIAQGWTEYDFLSGPSQYKKQLSTAEAPLVRVRVLRPGSMAALAQRWAEQGERALRTIWQQWREAHSVD